MAAVVGSIPADLPPAAGWPEDNPFKASGRVISEEDAVNGAVLAPDGFIYRPPPPSKQLTIDMQVSVTDCMTWRGVLEVVERDGDLFDARNTSTAIHRLGRYGADEGRYVLQHHVFPYLLLLLKAKMQDVTARSMSDASWGLAKIGCRDEEVFGRLASRGKELAKDLDPQGLALVAWSFATAGYRDEELFNILSSEALRKMDEFGPQNIANLVWATATVGYRNDPLHASIVAASLRGIEGFSSQELAMINWALTKLAFAAGDTWRTMFRKRVLHLKEYAPSEVSMIAWALATRGDYDPELMAFVSRRSMELMRAFTGQHIATVLWAIATVSYKDDPSIDEFLRIALGAIIARASEFAPLNLALISWALAKLAYRAEGAFEVLCDSARRQMDEFVPQNLVQMMWACATAGYRDEQFLQAASAVAKRTLTTFSPQHLSNFIWACARLDFREDTDLLHRFSAAALNNLEGSPQHLSNIAWAVSQIGPEHFPGLLQGIVATTSRRLDDFDAPSLMMLSDSLYEAKYGVGTNEPLMGTLRTYINGLGVELRDVFTAGLPRPRGACSVAEVQEYQRRLRSTGLVTFGYEHTTSLLTDLGLMQGPVWSPDEAATLPGWTLNARRTTTARRFALTVGSARVDEPGSVFTSAFASPAEDAACDFIVTWLGQGKADSPNTGRAGRSGDAECRAIVDTHNLVKEAMQQHSSPQVTGWVSFHTSGVPCLSCLGVAAQFKRCYPGVAVSFTFVQRENAWDGPELGASAPQGTRAPVRGSSPSPAGRSGTR